MSRSMPGSVVLAACALIALVSAPPEAQSTADASFLVVNARVFDGERLLEKTDVAVERHYPRRGTRSDGVGAAGGDRRRQQHDHAGADRCSRARGQPR